MSSGDAGSMSANIGNGLKQNRKFVSQSLSLRLPTALRLIMADDDKLFFGFENKLDKNNI